MENSSSAEPYFLGIISGNYGEYYKEKKEYDLAFPYLRKAFSNLVVAKDFFDQSVAYNDMAGIYFEQQQYDSSKQYAYKAVKLAEQDHFNQPLVDGYDILYKNYERVHNNDSAFKYLKLQLATKDSMFSEEKQKKVQGLALAEQIHEQEIATKEAIEEKNHKQTIETAAIGAGILIFIILFLLYSNSIIASPRLIRFLGVITLIVMFEFLYLVIDRYVMQYTNDSTLLMLLVWVILAAALSPLDEFINEWVKHRLVEKNKKIKIAAAHKVLDTLEAAE
jgi:tetratricopeptide (TPR) repeat protein